MQEPIRLTLPNPELDEDDSEDFSMDYNYRPKKVKQRAPKPARVPKEKPKPPKKKASVVNSRFKSLGSGKDDFAYQINLGQNKSSRKR